MTYQGPRSGKDPAAPPDGRKKPSYRIDMPSLKREAGAEARTKATLDVLVDVDARTAKDSPLNRTLMGHFRALPVGTRYTILIALLLMLGVSVFRAYWVSQPNYEAETTPDTVTIRDLQVVAVGKGFKFTGKVRNDSGRSIESVTFYVRCKIKGGEVVEVISASALGPTETRKFEVSAFKLKELPASQKVTPGVIRWRIG